MLRVRWLGRVPYGEAHALQRALHRHGRDDHLLLVEHDHVYTLGVRTDLANVLVDPASVGAAVARADRGGDVTYHGPGQLVGYPILSVRMGTGAVPAYVHAIEDVLIETLAALGLPGAGRLEGYPGVWAGLGGHDGPPRKIAAIGVRLTRGRTMHGFALNVSTDLSYFSHIVPCGIRDYGVTSLEREGLSPSMADVVDAVSAAAAPVWGTSGWERQDVTGRHSRPRAGTGAVRATVGAVGAPADLVSSVTAAGPVGSVVRLPEVRRARGLDVRMERAGVDLGASVPISGRKPEWLRAKARMGQEYRALRRTMRSLDLVTVCEEAGCPNIFECWSEGTATFMINGADCTRACGFCLVGTARPSPIDPGEADRIAEAVAGMGLGHAVVTAVARDDLPDGGASAFSATIAAIRAASPGTAVEVLVPDFKGNESALDTVFEARPDVFNHNLETVARLQRAVRPSAGYARSLSVLGRADQAGLVTKSGLVLGMGEERTEVLGALADLAAVGVDIVTIGQYLRPTERHVPVARWWRPEDFSELAAEARAMGFSHVEASPLTRSSYHARGAAAAAATQAAAAAGQATVHAPPAQAAPQAAPAGLSIAAGTR
ncbi:MAG: lipoyl synthase [Actinomycetota bacterium]|nr:lipoyl synthase [Actinomycetota bacterium]